jgi:2,3-dihydroxybenzoate decarboxylase
MTHALAHVHKVHPENSSGGTMRKIALEEHFTTKALAADSVLFASIAQPGVWTEELRRLLDRAAERLPAMDEAGLDVQVLSLNAPGIQAEGNASAAVYRASAVNDLLAEIIAQNPDRFAGFAALPLLDPRAAAKELERAARFEGLTSRSLIEPGWTTRSGISPGFTIEP